MATLPYARIKESFVRQLESLGLVSLDSGRHKQLSEAVDSFAEGLRKFFAEEQPEVVALKPKADPAASADDIAEWLPEIEAQLPTGWKFWTIPSAAHGAGRAIFAHYDSTEGTLVSGFAHVKLLTPKKELIDIKFRPDEGKEALESLVSEAVGLVIGSSPTTVVDVPLTPLNNAAKENESDASE